MSATPVRVTVEPVVKGRIIGHKNILHVSHGTGAVWSQLEMHWNVGPFAKHMRSSKTGALSWQWSLKTGFTV